MAPTVKLRRQLIKLRHLPKPRLVPSSKRTRKPKNSVLKVVKNSMKFWKKPNNGQRNIKQPMTSQIV